MKPFKRTKAIYYDALKQHARSSAVVSAIIAARASKSKSRSFISIDYAFNEPGTGARSPAHNDCRHKCQNIEAVRAAFIE